MKMFEVDEVSAELDTRLEAAGINPNAPDVARIKTIISGYFAERTAEVLTKVQEVLKTFGNGAQ